MLVLNTAYKVVINNHILFSRPKLYNEPLTKKLEGKTMIERCLPFNLRAHQSAKDQNRYTSNYSVLLEIQIYNRYSCLIEHSSRGRNHSPSLF